MAINSKIVSQLAELPVDIDERVMTPSLRLNNNQLARVINFYALTLDADEDLVLTAVLKEDKLVLLGNFNARVDCDYILWNSVTGKEWVGMSSMASSS